MKCSQPKTGVSSFMAKNWCVVNNLSFLVLALMEGPDCQLDSRRMQMAIIIKSYLSHNFVPFDLYV